jgi:branched-chain amino acid transport system permease protein
VKTPGLLVVAVMLALAPLPLFVHSDFWLHFAIMTLYFALLGQAWNLLGGYAGQRSFGHAAFFGTGAYAAAIVVTRYSLPLGEQVLVAVGAAVVLAIVIGIPAFRLSHLTFGMATLGFALILELIAQNQIGLTNGPLCMAGLSPLGSGWLGSLGINQGRQQYYIFLLIAVAVAAFVWLLVRSRIGRAYVAVREDEPMAMAAGINPKRYRMSAFVLGAALAGLLGAFYAHYLSVFCPTNLDISYTINLLVILFLGGTGGFWGIIAAAFIFTAIPEALQVAPNVRLIAYGAALLLGVLAMPEGFEGAALTLRRRLRRRRMVRNA